nr:nucleotide-binding, alpha-beta plait [Tanacetum cinerariifolium]
MQQEKKVTFQDPESARRACVDPAPIIDGRRANCNLASLGSPRHALPFGEYVGSPTPYAGGMPYVCGPYFGGSGYQQPPPYSYQQGLAYPPYTYTTYGPEYVYPQGIYNLYAGQHVLDDCRCSSEAGNIIWLHGKSFCHNNIKNDLIKFKGNDIVDNAAQVSNATTIAPGMYKLDPVTLAPKNKNNRETHIYYLKHTIEQAAILREIIEQAKSLNPLDSSSYSAYKYVKLIQELLGYVRDSCPDIYKPSKKLVAVTLINKKIVSKVFSWNVLIIAVLRQAVKMVKVFEVGFLKLQGCRVLSIFLGNIDKVDCLEFQEKGEVQGFLLGNARESRINQRRVIRINKGLRMMTGTKFDIEKFDGKNDFALWQVRMKDLLEQQGLVATLKEATIAACDNVIQKKAFGALIFVFRLYTFNMHPGKSQSEHIDEFHKLVGDLTAIDTAISDEDQALLLLTSLPSSYDNFVKTLLYGHDTMKLEDMLATLNSRELQKMTEAKGDGVSIAAKSPTRYCLRYNHKKSQGFVKNEDQGMPCMGTGKVQVQMRDVSSLISLGTLEKEGFTVKMQSGKIKAFRKQLGEYQTGWKIKTGNVLDFCNQRNMGFNESGEYKKTFIGSGVVGSQEVQTKGLIYYHSVRDKEQHSACELFSYREDSNEAAFVVAAVDKIYAHESLTFNNIVASTIARNVVTTMMANTESIHQSLLDKAKGNVLGLEIVRDQSGNTLRVSQSMFYNGKLVQILLEGHSILSLEGSLSGDYDVEKNGKWSCIYAVGSHEYQMVCTRLDIASEDVAAYMTLTEAAKEAIWLKGLAIESGFKLKIVAGIATGALSKDIHCSRFQHRTFPVFGRAKDVTPCAILASLIVYPPPGSS